jgi:amidase
VHQAKRLDDFYREHSHLIGPLHGIPISLKDQFNVKGLDSTLGYVGRAFAPAASDALLVDVLRQLGAIIIAKTNLPQSIMVRGSDDTSPFH